MGFIKQLKQFLTGTHIFPITKTNAVYDDTVGRLDTFMQNLLVGADTLESETDDLPRDADTLGGHLPEYFAKAEVINELIGNFGEFKKKVVLKSDISLLDLSLDNGFYYVSKASDYPTEYANYGFLIVIQESINYRKILWSPYGDNVLYIRTCSNGAWSEWDSFANNRNNIGNYIDITGYNSENSMYTFPCDGYVMTYSVTLNTFCNATIFGANNIACAWISAVKRGERNESNSVFVKKGMKTTVYTDNPEGAYIWFRPII